jgi:hypothetical protein
MVQRSNKIRDSPQWRYKDDDIPGVLRDPPDEEKGRWVRWTDPADNRDPEGELSYGNDQAALMWFTGT